MKIINNVPDGTYLHGKTIKEVSAAAVDGRLALRLDFVDQDVVFVRQNDNSGFQVFTLVDVIDATCETYAPNGADFDKSNLPMLAS